MLITKELLENVGCCKKGINDAIHAGLIPCELDDVDIEKLVKEHNVNFCSLVYGFNSSFYVILMSKITEQYFNTDNTEEVRVKYMLKPKGFDNLYVDSIILPVKKNTPKKYFSWQIELGNLCVEKLRSL